MDHVNRTGKSLLCFVIGLLLVSNSFSQQIFYSQSLQNLYYSLPETCRDVTGNDFEINAIIFCYDVIQGDTVPIVYHWDENKVLEHIGYRFVAIGDTVTTNAAVVRFIERELLTLLTTSDLNQTLVSYHENDLSIQLNDKPVKLSFLQDKQGLLSLLKNYMGITINFINGKMYEVSLVFNKNQKLSFNFPADNELLTGMDKKESDIRLAVQLKNHKAKPDRIVAPDYGYLQLLSDSIYVERGNSFIVPQINNDIFYTKIDSSYNLIFDSRLLAETFSNTLIVPANKNYTINITHRLYGNQVKKYTVNNCDFNDYFRSGYDRYFGIESLDKDKLTGTLILTDRNTNAIHLAFVSISLDDLLNGGTMEMQLYSNIPQHNIKTLFGK